MKLLRYVVMMIAVFIMAIGIIGCGNSTANSENTASQPAVESKGVEPGNGNGSDAIIVYFSASGYTEKAAQHIAKVTGADLYRIVPEQPYTDADLNYRDNSSRSVKEHEDPSIRPAIAGPDVDLSKYKTVYVGYPIWWGEAPNIVYTFVENHNFDGKTVIPFATSASSGIGNSGPHLGEAAKTGTWKHGFDVWGNESDSDIQKLINGD